MAPSQPISFETPAFFRDSLDCGVGIGRLGDAMVCRFPVRPLPQARLLWLNERAVLDVGIDITCDDVRQDYEHWLVTTFGVRATEAPPRKAENGLQSLCLEADRYGGTGGAVHGGSGRSGSRHGLNAKGIGRTPLVSPSADLNHSHGFMSLAEAIREAVNAEIAIEELPHGAVPVIAIIDAGFTFRLADDGRQQRAAIVVRPEFLRPAHFERSLFFGTAGHAHSHQFQDAVRVRQAVRTMAQSHTAPPLLDTMFHRFARQLGEMRARRLWQGQFLTSNIAIDGALADFGAFRAVPTWQRYAGLAGERFGSELGQLRKALLSVSFYFAKYASDLIGTFDLRRLWDEVRRTEAAAFSDAIVDGLGLRDHPRPDLAERIVALVHDYYRHQQSSLIGDDLCHRASWIHDLFKAGAPGTFNAPAAETATAGAIHAALVQAAATPGNASASLFKASHFFRPRPLIHLFRALTSADRAEDRVLAHPAGPREALRRHIDGQVGRSLRTWRGLPPHLDVTFARRDPLSLVCGVRDIRNGATALWIRARATGATARILGRHVTLPEMDSAITAFGNWYCAEIAPPQSWRPWLTWTQVRHG